MEETATLRSTLIVIHGNRYVEVFSSEKQRVKIVNVPDMRSAQGELLIQELLGLRLSRYWSKVYREGFLIDRDEIKDTSVIDIVKRDADIAMLRTMNGIILQNMDVQPCTK